MSDDETMRLHNSPQTHPKWGVIVLVILMILSVFLGTLVFTL